jgi:hypothetical protein
VSVLFNDRRDAARDGYRRGDTLTPAKPAFTLTIDAAIPEDAARTAYLVGHGLFRDRPVDPWPKAVPAVGVGDVFHILAPDPDGVPAECWIAIGKTRMEPLPTNPTNGGPA